MLLQRTQELILELLNVLREGDTSVDGLKLIVEVPTNQGQFVIERQLKADLTPLITLAEVDFGSMEMDLKVAGVPVRLVSQESIEDYQRELREMRGKLRLIRAKYGR